MCGVKQITGENLEVKTGLKITGLKGLTALLKENRYFYSCCWGCFYFWLKDRNILEPMSNVVLTRAKNALAYPWPEKYEDTRRGDVLS